MTSSAGAIQRFLEPQFSGQFGWFLPLAVVGLILGCIWIARRQGSPGMRALMVMSATWFATSATVVAFMSGIVHPYYTLTAVPPLCTVAAARLGVPVPFPDGENPGLRHSDITCIDDHRLCRGPSFHI